MPGKRILCVGLVTLDIINVCERYPGEDEDLRAVSQRWQRGGNASNTSVVLSQFPVQCEFLGTLSRGFEADFALEDLKKRGVKSENCVFHENCGFPTACAVLSLETGSRTIVHSGNSLPMLRVGDFEKIALHQYDWIHFEGMRNVPEILQMIDRIDSYNSQSNSKIRVSVELEKARENLDALLPRGDVVFLGRTFAESRGCMFASEAVTTLYPKCKQGACLICAWGGCGADAMGPDGQLLHSDAFPPDKIVDTLGAGDTFIAGMIYSLCQEKSLKEAITFACKLAGMKCGVEGYDGLAIALGVGCAS